MRSVTMAAKPTSVQVDLDRLALIVIDMQKDFLYNGGYGESLGNDPTLLRRTIRPVQALLSRARSLGMHIVHTREGHLPDLSDCPETKLLRWPKGRRIGDIGPMGRILVRGESGHAIIDEVAPLAGETVIDKPGKDAFYKTDLEARLRAWNVRDILFAGVTTDVCCSTSIGAANDRGFNGVVLADCMASYDPQRHAATLDIISAQGGIFGWVSDSASLFAALNQAR